MTGFRFMQHPDRAGMRLIPILIVVVLVPGHYAVIHAIQDAPKPANRWSDRHRPPVLVGFRYRRLAS